VEGLVKRKRVYVKHFFFDQPHPDAARLERLRKKLGLSMQRFAPLLGISLRTYLRYTTDEHRVAPARTVMLLAHYLERFPREHAELVSRLKRPE
jgi:transcriptional regulator with XRE-family HTH domain